MGISLRAARVNKGYTQKQASKLLGISEPTLINYETFKNSPKISMLNKMAELYNIKVKDLNLYTPNNNEWNTKGKKYE